MSQPLVVSYGAGRDSTGMIVEMYNRGIRPDAIVFADTGAEKPETYAYLPIFNAWLLKVGFPEITVVKYEPTRATYHTLEEKCLTNETLPSLAFGKHSCAIVFKHEPQDKFLRSWAPAVEAWAAGLKVTKAIGYDDGAQDRRRRDKADRACAKKLEVGSKDSIRYVYWYPLQDWGLDVARCIELIKAAGLPVPVKSACFFCPASKKTEVIELRDTQPLLFWRAVAIERGARDGKHGLDTCKGLGRQFAWEDLVAADAASVIDGPEQLRP